MDVTGMPLTESIMRSWIVELTEPESEFRTGELYNQVHTHHLTCGGIDSEADEPKKEFQKALAALRREGILEKARYGWWTRTTRTPPAEQALTDESMENADVRIGEGSEEVYAWYLPISRELVELKGDANFAMKVGRTNRTAEDRVRESIGALPERPIVGFVWRTDDSVSGEKVLHGTLAFRGWHLPDAIGNEWYLTNPEELRCIISEPQSLLPKG